MKKIVGIIAAAALAATAFAEINIGSWNRAVFVPFHYDGSTLRSYEGRSWDADTTGGVRTGLSFSGSTDNAGFVMEVHGNPGNALELGSNAYTWVKPVDMLTVKFGKIDNNWGRLDHCFGTWDLWRFSNEEGEGIGGVGRQNGLGAEVTLQPVEGLVIDYEANFSGDTNHTYDVMWESASFMVGYQADFGFIRAIVNGQQASYYKFDDTDTKPAAQIGIAADITAIENLTLKLGASLPTNLSGYVPDTSTDPAVIVPGLGAVKTTGYVKAAVGADYKLDPITIHGQVNLAVNPKKVEDAKVQLGTIGLNIGAGIDYAINDTFTVVTDVRFTTDKYTLNGYSLADNEFTYKDSAFGAYLGLTQNLTNASFSFGAQFGKHVLPTAATEADAFTFAVPFTMTVSF